MCITVVKPVVIYLFYQMTELQRSKSYKFNSENFDNENLSKERITNLMCAKNNERNREKRKLLVALDILTGFHHKWAKDNNV